ncbi:cytochrome P450 family protein [Nocardia pneumoniae]|uniref:cytochrome P450 family protein n=1 Tax=Nocardia pneumoniae TaxID=228601 RepID=UPI0002F7F243|nr:cytochrome P450 [Nocardia pneumoniae]
MRELPADFFRTPYAFYEQLRAEGPVHRIRLRTGVRAWLVVDYDAARDVLRHPDVRKDPNTAAGAHARQAAAGRSGVTAINPRLSHHLLNADPPRHSRLRKLVTPAFAPARMEALAPRVAAIADDLLDAIDRTEDAAGQVDLLAEYAFPLPVTVICEVLGVPVEDRARFREWSAAVVDSPMSTAEGMRTATDAIVDYFDGLVARRRAEGLGDDLISQLLLVSDEGERLGHDELISMAFLILVAGHETTVNLIGNTVLELLTDPPRYRALHDDPAGVPALVEEMLRYNGPVNMVTLRYTTAPVALGGSVIPEGELVLVAVASANRDERHFAAPATFDPDRAANGHLAFGHGIHYCLGAGLARLEARIALTRLVRRYPRLRLAADDTDLRWRESILIRGLLELPVVPESAPAMR